MLEPKSGVGAATMYFPSMRLESDKRRKLFRAIVVYPDFNVESRKSLFESGLVIISAKPVLGRYSFESAFQLRFF